MGAGCSAPVAACAHALSPQRQAKFSGVEPRLHGHAHVEFPAPRLRRGRRYDLNRQKGRLRIDVKLGRHLGAFVEPHGNGWALVVGRDLANGVNPLEYLADVLVPVNTHPNKQIDELLPHLWGRTAGNHLAA